MNAITLRSVTPTAAPTADPADDVLVIEWFDQWTGPVGLRSPVVPCYCETDTSL